MVSVISTLQKSKNIIKTLIIRHIAECAYLMPMADVFDVTNGVSARWWMGSAEMDAACNRRFVHTTPYFVLSLFCVYTWRDFQYCAAILP